MLIVIYIILLILCFLKLKFYKHGFNTDYLSKDNCNFVKGVFIILVFISHINIYIQGSGYSISSIGDALYFQIISFFGQLIVVMFLFFSGFGIMESYKHKGSQYLKDFPKKRIITTLLNFDIAVCFYIILNLIIGKEMTIDQVFLSMTTWSSIGNSNWYIFCILLCYSLAFLCLFIGEKLNLNNQYVILIIFVSTAIIAYLLSFLKEPWWYNTIMCFPFGMLYSYNKTSIDRIIKNHYYSSLLFCISIFLIARFSPIATSIRGTAFNIVSILFVVLVVLLMMKIKSENIYLQWMGANLFPLYIYQRLIMIAIYELPGGKDFIVSFPLLYITISFVGVLIIASQYKRWRISFT